MADYPPPLSIEPTLEKEIDLNNLPFIENQIKEENNVLYNLKIYNVKQSIIFSLEKNNDFSEINYKNEYTLEQLNKIDIFANNYKSIEEIYTEFFKNFKKKEFIVIENKNSLNLNIKFENLGKIKEIKFYFYDYKLNIEKTIFKVCDKIKEIDKYNNNLNEKQTNIDEETKKIKEENKNNNDKLLNEFNKLKTEIKKYEENLKDNQNETKIELEKYKKQLEKNRKEMFRINIIVIISIIIISLLYINSKFNNIITNIDNNYNNKYNKNINVNDIDNKFKVFNKTINDDIDNRYKSLNNKNLKDIDNKFQSFKSKIDDIDKKFKYLNINDIDNKFKSLNNINLKDIGNQFQSFNNKIKYIDIYMSFIFQLNKINYNSLLNYANFNIFNSLINKGIKHYFDKEIKNMKLLFQGSTDGFDSTIFHKKCDDKKNTVILVITETNIIFGGFTELEWNPKNSFIEGTKGFIFFVNDEKIYYNKNKYRIYTSEYEGPDFNEVFYIEGKRGFIYENPSYKYFDISAKDFNIQFKDYFLLKDYAIFQIDI